MGLVSRLVVGPQDKKKWSQMRKRKKSKKWIHLRKKKESPRRRKMESPRRRKKWNFLLDLGIHNKSKIWIHQEQHETLKA
jgi:hypothetical protein